ncbi:MAG: DUF1870 family protein [Limnohabitans sp.]|nr:DUF1870 family protein [Limnohabitans sp.]
MNGLELKNFRKSLKMTQSEFANKIGVTSRTLQNWEGGINEIPSTAKLVIDRLIEENDCKDEKNLTTDFEVVKESVKVEMLKEKITILIQQNTDLRNQIEVLNKQLEEFKLLKDQANKIISITEKTYLLVEWLNKIRQVDDEINLAYELAKKSNALNKKNKL